MDGGAWQATVHEAQRLSAHTHAHTHTHTHTHTHGALQQVTFTTARGGRDEDAVTRGLIHSGP